MSVAYYAASFAQYLTLKQGVDVTLGYSSGTASLAETIGTLMETERLDAQRHDRDYWPQAGAEAAAWFLNTASETLSYEELRAGAIHAAVTAGMTEGNSG